MAEKKLIEPGRWYSELDENGNYKSIWYDEAYRRLLGFETEEEYRRSFGKWTDRVHPDDAERIREHTAWIRGKHPHETVYDIEYRMLTKYGYHWFHDYGVCTRLEDGTLVRCDGVVFDIQDAVVKEETRKKQIAMMAGGVSAYIVDPVTGRIQIISQNAYLAEHYSAAEDYAASIARYIEKDVYGPDRKAAEEKFTLEAMAGQFETGGEYTFRFRDISRGRPRWYEMRAVKLSEREILIGFSDKDDEIVAGMMSRRMEENYFGLHYIDLDTGFARVIKTRHPEITGDAGTETPYPVFMKRIAASTAGEAREFLTRISEFDGLTAGFASEETNYYIFKSHVFEGDRWVNATGLVLRRHEDGTPALMAIGFSLLDEDSCRKEEAQLKLRESMEVVGGLAGEYTALYHVDLDTDGYVPYHLAEIAGDILPYVERCPRFTDLARAFTASLLVHPEDREKLRAFYPSAGEVRERLTGKKRFSMLFRRNYGGRFLWTEAVIVKCEAEQEEAHRIIVGFLERDREIRERSALFARSERSNRLIENIAAKYNLAYTVNLAEDSFRLLRMDRDIVGNGMTFNTFTEAKEFFLTEVVHPADKVRLRQTLDYAGIRQKLKDVNTFSTEYRALINGVSVWHEMIITLLAGDDVAIGFAVKDLEITKRHLEEKRYGEYLALFVIDLDTEMIKPLKTSPLFRTAPVGEAVPYEQAMRSFADIYSGEARDFFNSIADLGYVRQELFRDDKRTFSYRSAKLGEEKWIDVVSYVIDRHADGTPAVFTLGFSIVDALATARRELLNRLNADMQMIGGLAGEYYTLYYYNIDDGVFKIYAMDGKKFPEHERFIRNGTDPVTMLYEFGSSQLVHPEDRHLFVGISVAYIRERLARSKRFSIRFRRRFGAEYRWVAMDIVKYEAAGTQANAIVIGFADRDAEIRSEQAMSRCFEILSTDIPPQESIDTLLAVTGEFYGAERCYIFEYAQNRAVISNTYEWCARGTEPMIDKLQNVPAEEIEGWIREFRRHGTFSADSLDENGAYNSEAGRELLEMQGIDSLIAAPLMNGSEIVGMVGVDNPSQAKKNTEVLKNVAAVAYSEILQRKENGEERVTLEKLTDAFVSVYYADIDSDYMRTWKIDEAYREAYGRVEHYSVSMGGYVRENIAERDRERCIKMTSPEYIREQFRTTDRFSVEMTDIMLGYERNCVFDFIKVSRSGSEFVICCRDVTETLKKEREQAATLDLANQQRHIKVFGDMVNAALWSLDIDENNEVTKLYWSDELRRMFGFAASEEDFPNTAEAWSSRLHPEDKERTVGQIKAALASRDTESFVYDTEYRIRRKTGEYCWYHAAGRMEESEGGRRLYGIIFDISADKQLAAQKKQLEEALQKEIERSREEKAYQLAILNNAYSYFRIDLTGNRIIPPIIEREHGQPVDYTGKFPSPLPGYDEIMALGAARYVDDAYKESYRAYHSCANLIRCFREGDLMPEYICRIYSTTIGWHYRKYITYLSRDESSGGIYGMSVAYDVTREQEAAERERQYKAELEEARQAAEAANKSKTDFLFNMSHDIRTPMNAITGFTSMAVKHIDDKEKTLDCLNKIQKSGSMLLSLINSVLEVSRIESGHATLDRQPGDVYFSFVNIESTLRELAEAKDIRLTFEFGDIRNRYVYADFARCMRVFVNVISNAIKYTPEGGTVQVRCEQPGEAKDGFVICRYTVADNGIGMSEEFQKHVFEQFSRENTATVSGIQGTGLGMAVVKSFVDLMGGTITVRSRQGEGSVFTIDLPFALQEEKESTYIDPVTGKTVSHRAEAAANRQESLAGRRVLLVEDNELNREIATEILEEEGIVVEDADDGTTAVDILREKGPDYYDFILMDIQMPVMNGYDATRAIRKMYPDARLPIIALSANAFAEDKAAAIAAGMNDHVSKPINLEELFGTLRKYLKR